MRKNNLKLACGLLTLILASNTLLAVPTTNQQTTTASPYQTSAPKEDKMTSPSDVFVVDNFKIIQTTLERLGVKPDELEKMIKEGKTLQQVLEAKKIKTKKFKKCVLKQYYTVINEGVKNKQITETQGEMLKKAIKDKVMNWLKDK